MKLLLSGIQQLGLTVSTIPTDSVSGGISAEVLFCAICRTDAKLWNEGQRDLVLPRVPGHEMVVRYYDNSYVVWPGIVCGTCEYCQSGKENLCESIKIIGFHVDGGFSDRINIPESCLIPIPADLPLHLATFAEPAGCIVNAFRKIDLKAKERILIYGCGANGLLAALLAKVYGAEPTIIEKYETKIYKAKAFIHATGIPVIKDTTESQFDCVINACADPSALINAISRTIKGGRIAFFSGLSKNIQLESNLLNLVHYKELQLIGSYGLTPSDMKKGIHLLVKTKEILPLLIENTIEPEMVEGVLPDIIKGEPYKYIIDFTSAPSTQKYGISSITENKKQNIKTITTIKMTPSIPLFSTDLIPQAQQKIDTKTKPLGSLGTLEELAVKMSCIQDTLTPVIEQKNMFVFAADHGIAEEGVSAFPQEVTRQMVLNFLNEGAAINVLSNFNKIDLAIIDMGVKGEPLDNKKLINKRIASGTKNFALEPAMTIEQAEQALQAGIDVFMEQYMKRPVNIAGLGEMGIANTTSATALISAITGKSVAECTGRGTGIDNQGLNHKIKVIEKALSFQKPNATNGIELLSKIGGFEIAAMAGVALAAASQRCAVVLDGLISTAAGLVAYILNPDVTHYFISGHKSVEKGHIYALEHLQLTPVLDLNMRLGEGTGAALTMNLVDAACHIMRDMASFDEAGVSNKE